MKRLLSVAIAAAFLFTPAFAQMHEAGDAGGEINFIAGIPQGAFDDGIVGESVGASVFFGGRIAESIVVLGSELGFLNYGKHSNLTLHSTVLDGGIDGDLAFPVEAVRTSASNNVYLGHLVFRIAPHTGSVRPYVDALAGLKYFSTHLDVESDVVVFERGLDQDANVTDFAFSYGVGGGLELELYGYASAWSRTPATVSLHAGVRYLFGTRARYAAGSAFEEVGGRFVIDVRESRTDMLVPQFGLRVRQ